LPSGANDKSATSYFIYQTFQKYAEAVSLKPGSKSCNLFIPQIPWHSAPDMTGNCAVTAHRDITPEKIAEILFLPPLVMKIPSEIGY
jgi:hypothetical protein